MASHSSMWLTAALGLWYDHQPHPAASFPFPPYTSPASSCCRHFGKRGPMSLFVPVPNSVRVGKKNTMRLFFRGLGFPSSYFNYNWKRNSLLWDYFSKISQGAFPARHHSLHSSLQSLPYITTECSPRQIIHEKHPMGEI